MPFQIRGTSGGLLRSKVLLVAAGVTAGVLPAAVSRAFDAGRVEPSVYKIYTFIPDKNDQYTVSSGSGFLISGRRHVVTNFHVVEGGARFYIAFRDGREAKMIEARRADSRPNVDLALLEAREDLPGEPLKLGEYEPEKLAEVVAIGFPGAANLNQMVAGPDARGVPITDLDSTMTTGVVSRMTFTNLKVSETQILSARTVQHNSAINPGNSGGPLFDACGLVVGVNTLQGLNSQGLFFSIHADEVGRFLREGKISFASTSRPCASGLSSSLLPLVFGLTATLALASLVYVARTRRLPRALQALPQAFARLASARSGGRGSTRKGRGKLFPSFAGGGDEPLVLRPVIGGATVRLDPGGRSVTLGRGPGTDIVVADDTVSKLHARLSYDRDADRVRVTDLNSSNGTYLNGARVNEGAAASGARLRLGTLEYAVERETPPADAVGSSGAGWMLSGFDASGRALQFELRPATDPGSGRELPATWTFGRDPSRANFVIDDSSVSSLHAQLMLDPGEALMLRDMGSMNGTRIDGESIGTRTVTLRDTGQDIAFGLAVLRLSRLSS